MKRVHGSRQGRVVFAIVVALSLASCHTGRTMNSAWTVAVTTEGGIAGRGLGSVSLSSDGEPFLNRDAIAKTVAAADPEAWKSAYVPPGNPHGYADQILYKLTLTRNGRTYSTSWYDQGAPQLPSDLVALFDVVWATRSKPQ